MHGINYASGPKAFGMGAQNGRYKKDGKTALQHQKSATSGVHARCAVYRDGGKNVVNLIVFSRVCRGVKEHWKDWQAAAAKAPARWQNWQRP